MSYESARCTNYETNLCQSCKLFAVAPNSRSSRKTKELLQLCEKAKIPAASIAPIWIPPLQLGSRHKVKAAIGGTIDQPTIGFVDDQRIIRPLTDCPLLHPALNELLLFARGMITEYSLTPYDIENRRGELKYIIATLDPTGSSGIVRFVTRSSESHPRLKKGVAALQKSVPWAKVVTTNVQPEAAALLEGPTEEILTEARDVPMNFGIFTAIFGPQSFMQVTPAAAEALYTLARDKVIQMSCPRVLNLYCGVGGFSFAAAPHATEVLGIEISENAIECARRGSILNGFKNCRFESGDVFEHRDLIRSFKPELIVVNPPRGGLRAEIIDLLLEISPARILYSSCNPKTLFRDLEMLNCKFENLSVHPFDMFPLTEHLEVVVVLESKNLKL